MEAGSRAMGVQQQQQQQATSTSLSTTPPAIMAHALTLAMCSVRSMSVASISSEGSTESQAQVEQEEIAVLTHDVRNFKEALGHLRKVFQPDRDNQESIRVAAHERLGEVLRILRTVLEKYPVLQYAELLMSAGTLIQHVKGYSYEGEKSNPKEFFEAIDQLALAFSSRVSEYLMGDLDANTSLSSLVSSKTKSYEALASRGLANRAWSTGPAGIGADDSSIEQPELELLNTEQAVESLLRRAKLCSKYLKDMMTYVEKRANLDLEYAKNLAKLAQTVRPLISEESHLPFQSIYCAALDHDIKNSTLWLQTSNNLLGNKFIEPTSLRRGEHERKRKQLKEQWHREIKRMQDAESVKRKAYALFVQRTQTIKNSPVLVDTTEATKLERKQRRAEDDACHKALEAEASYKAACSEVEDRIVQLQKVKAEILLSLQNLLLQYDQTMKAATVNYFQQQYMQSSPAPIQFQSLGESSRQYEAGSQYQDFVRRFCALASRKHALESSTSYPNVSALLEKDHNKSQETVPIDDMSPQGAESKSFVTKAWSNAGQSGHSLGSDTDSMSSSHSTKSREPSPTTVAAVSSRPTGSSGDELEHDAEQDNANGSSTPCLSKAAMSHKFRALITPSRCRECDSFVYFQGSECIECSLQCHKKCLETLAIQCGHKRLPGKLTTFGVDLSQHLTDTNAQVPHLITKCINEIDLRGLTVKGIYRISGVKSKVEKLCQAFENGADLVDLSDINLNVIANVLKLYLRQLPEPLLTFHLYPSFIKTAREYPATVEPSCALQDLEDLMLSLPHTHFLTLSALMQHLSRVASNSSVNAMPPSNLGIVFGPTLLRTEGNDTLNAMVDTVFQSRTVDLLISNSSRLFPPSSSEEYLPPKTNSAERLTMISSSSVNVNSKCISQHLQVSQSSAQQPVYVTLPGFVAEPMSSPDLDNPLPHQGGDDAILGITSDEELPESLLPDFSHKSRKSPIVRFDSIQGSSATIFQGNLRDYKGLEGTASLILNIPDSSNNIHQQPKKNVSDCNPINQELNQHLVKSGAHEKRGDTLNVTESSFKTQKHSSSMSCVEKFSDSVEVKQQGGTRERRDSERKQDSLVTSSRNYSSKEESQSEEEGSSKTGTSFLLNRAATIPAHYKGQTPNIPGHTEKVINASSSAVSSVKQHFSVVTSHFVGVGRRTSSARGDTRSSTKMLENITTGLADNAIKGDSGSKKCADMLMEGRDVIDQPPLSLTHGFHVSKSHPK